MQGIDVHIATFPIATWFELAISTCKIEHLHGRLKVITSTEDLPDTSSLHLYTRHCYNFLFEILAASCKIYNCIVAI